MSINPLTITPISPPVAQTATEHHAQSAAPQTAVTTSRIHLEAHDPKMALARLFDLFCCAEELIGSLELPKTSQHLRDLYTQAAQAIRSAPPSQVRKEELKSLTAFGNLIHHLNEDPVGTEHFIESDVATTTHNLETIQLDLIGIVQQLEGKNYSPKALDTQLARQVAELLLLRNGKINYALIPALRAALPHITKGRHHAPMRQALTSLELNPKMRRKIEGASADKLDPKSEPIVRALCVLPPNQTITDFEIKKSLLSALLSNMRQGNIGSCFATSVGIGIKAWEPESAIDDFIEILQNGQLIKRVSGHDYTVAFQFKMNEETIHAPIHTESLKSAVKIGGFAEDQLPKARWGGVQASEQLKKLLEQMPGDPTSNQQLLINAYEAQSRCPLLRAWEGCLGSMSTLVPRHRRGFNPLGGLLWALNDEHQFKRRFFDRIRYVFDHAIKREHRRIADKPLGSGFTPHDTHDSNDSHDWEPIDTPTKFQEFLLSVLEECGEKDNRLAQMRIRSPEGMLSMLRACDSDNKDAYLSQSSSINYTPWSYRAGGHEQRVLSVYRGWINRVTLPPGFKPKSCEDLLSTILKAAAALPQQIKAKLSLRPDLPFAVCNNTHAFTLTLGDQTMRELWNSKKGVRTVLEEKLLSKAREAASQPVSDHLKLAAKNRFGLSEEVKGLKTRQELRNYIVKRASCSEHKVDSWLFRRLPKEEQAKVKSGLIRFADLNYYEGAQDVHLGMSFHPFTGGLMLWRMHDEKGAAYIEDHTRYITTKTWNIYPCTTSYAT